MKQRPMSVLIFGILNIGYGLFNLAAVVLGVVMSRLGPSGNPVADAMKTDPTMAAWNKVAMPLGVILALALIAFGIGLLLSKNWARLGSIVWSVFEIFLKVIGSIMAWPITQRALQQMPNMPRGPMVLGVAKIFMVLGIIVFLAYPAVLLFFMTRDNVIDACQPEQAPTQA
jgi:hypothetical protein